MTSPCPSLASTPKESSYAGGGWVVGSMTLLLSPDAELVAIIAASAAAADVIAV